MSPAMPEYARTVRTVPVLRASVVVFNDMYHPCRGAGGAVAVIDVEHAGARSAAREHAGERGFSALRGAVAHRRGHSEKRF